MIQNEERVTAWKIIYLSQLCIDNEESVQSLDVQELCVHTDDEILHLRMGHRMNNYVEVTSSESTRIRNLEPTE